MTTMTDVATEESVRGQSDATEELTSAYDPDLAIIGDEAENQNMTVARVWPGSSIRHGARVNNGPNVWWNEIPLGSDDAFLTPGFDAIAVFDSQVLLVEAKRRTQWLPSTWKLAYLDNSATDIQGHLTGFMNLYAHPVEMNTLARTMIAYADVFRPTENTSAAQTDSPISNNPQRNQDIRLVNRIRSEIRFFANVFRETLAHPLSTSVIDKSTGRLIERSRKDDY